MSTSYLNCPYCCKNIIKISVDNNTSLDKKLVFDGDFLKHIRNMKSASYHNASSGINYEFIDDFGSRHKFFNGRLKAAIKGSEASYRVCSAGGYDPNASYNRIINVGNSEEELFGNLLLSLSIIRRACIANGIKPKQLIDWLKETSTIDGLETNMGMLLNRKLNRSGGTRVLPSYTYSTTHNSECIGTKHDSEEILSKLISSIRFKNLDIGGRNISFMFFNGEHIRPIECTEYNDPAVPNEWNEYLDIDFDGKAHAHDSSRRSIALKYSLSFYSSDGENIIEPSKSLLKQITKKLEGVGDSERSIYGDFSCLTSDLFWEPLGIIDLDLNGSKRKIMTCGFYADGTKHLIPKRFSVIMKDNILSTSEFDRSKDNVL